jgi:hypothetical protein
MNPTPHLQKLNAASANAKCSKADQRLLQQAKKHYETWVQNTKDLKNKGRARVDDMVTLLNEYKDQLEVDLIAKRGSDFLKRQKGQLKLDNSVIEEFLPYLICPEVEFPTKDGQLSNVG